MRQRCRRAEVHADNLCDARLNPAAKGYVMLGKRRTMSAGVLGAAIVLSGLATASPASAATSCTGTADNSAGYVNVYNCVSTLRVRYLVYCNNPFAGLRSTAWVTRPNGSLHLKYDKCDFLGVNRVEFEGYVP